MKIRELVRVIGVIGIVSWSAESKLEETEFRDVKSCKDQSRST